MNNLGRITQFNAGSTMILFSLFVLSVGQPSPAQDSSVTGHSALAENPRITWVDQFPLSGSEKDIQKKNRGFIDFVFGRKNSLSLTKPVNIASRNTDEYWVLDQSNGVIFNINHNVGDIPHIRGKQFARFPSLVGICFFPGNKILFTDSYLNKIFIYNPDKKEVRILNDSISFEQPTGIAYSEINHEIWVVETKAHAISVLNDKGHRKKIIGRRGEAPGEFNYPTSIWIDKSGKAYVVDALNFRIQIFNKDGELIAIFGKNGDGGGNLARPKGIATDSYGHIYIVDALFNAVQIFDISGNFLYAFGSQGQDKGEFWMPSGIYIDDNDYIYIADSYNSKVQVFQFQNGDRR
jgi:DNA-binding beta-propeller fold protein YncE